MKAILAPLLLILLAMAPMMAEDTLKSDMDALVGQVRAKLQKGEATEKDLAAELARFDELAKKYSENAEQAADILMAKAMLYLQVFNDPEKGAEVVEKIQKEFPNTRIGSQADKILTQIKAQGEAMATNKQLAVGSQFPAFEVESLDGKPLSIQGTGAKVVLIDFWATWCGPCVQELPGLKAVYDKYKDKGFQIIGISLDKEKAALEGFVKKENITWPQYFDGKGFENSLARKYGINSIPSMFLVDGSGKILARDVRGHNLEEAVSKALGGS